MKLVHVAAFALLGAGLCSVPIHAAEIGDPAAPLKISEWLKGGPVDLAAAKGSNIVVVEFWATWCPPCRTSIPHLTELQRKFKDQGVIIVGISGEEVTEIKPFVTKIGDKMDYVVAADDTNATARSYMTAYGQSGIPHAFIVDRAGRMVWHGHPMTGLDEALGQLVAGKFDLEGTKKRSTAAAKLQEYHKLLLAGGEEAKVAALEKDLLALDRELGGITPGQKFDPAQSRKRMGFNRLVREYQQAFAQASDLSRIEELERKLVAAAPPDFNLAEFKQELRAQLALVVYMQEAAGSADPAKLASLGQKLEAASQGSANAMNQVAWTLLTDESIKTRDLALATRLAKAACDKSEGKDASILDTYARALFDSGKVAEAIQQQKKAIALCKNETLLKTLEENLKTYEAKASRR